MNPKSPFIRWAAIPVALLAFSTAVFAVDTDGDGLDDVVETNTGIYVSPANTGTNPANADTDGDGVPDGLEVKEKTSPVDATKFNSFSTGMVAFWPFNGNANDETGRGNNGITSNVTSVPDRLANTTSAFQFNGSTSTIRVASSISAGRDLTFSYWAKFTPPAAGGGMVMGRDGWQNGYVHNQLDSTSISCVAAADSPQGFQVFPYSSQLWKSGDWNHVVFVRSSLNMKYYCYINGVLFGEQNQTFLHTPTSVAPLQIGAWKGFSGGLERFFAGTLDDIRIYDRALTASEVTTLNRLESGKQFLLNASAVENGSVSGAGQYEVGTTATLTATPNSGYIFNGWTGDASGSTNPLQIVMDWDKTIGADFNPDTADDDGDGLTNFAEIVTYGTDPTKSDTDGDGFNDKFEIDTGFDPKSASSTPDAASSIRTAVEFRFNAANGVSYRIEDSTDLQDWNAVETGIVGQGGVVTRFYSTENIPKRYFRVRKQ